MRKPHLFEKCYGDPVNVSYAPPRPNPAMKGFDVERLLDEFRHGVTVVTFRCDKCGRKFENRYLGDQRAQYAVEAD